MELRSVVLFALLVSLVLSSVLSFVILPPTRAVLRRLCPAEESVAFWTRFTVLMLFLGPMSVTLIFGVPYSGDLSGRLTPTDVMVRVITAALIGSFLTLGGIGLRIGTARPPMAAPPAPKRSDDERIR